MLAYSFYGFPCFPPPLSSSKYLVFRDQFKEYLPTGGGFLGGSESKESAFSAGDLGSIPGFGRSSGEGNGYPLQYSGLENSMDSPWGHKESGMTEQLSISHDPQISLFLTGR